MFCSGIDSVKFVGHSHLTTMAICAKLCLRSSSRSSQWCSNFCKSSGRALFPCVNLHWHGQDKSWLAPYRHCPCLHKVLPVPTAVKNPFVPAACTGKPQWHNGSTFAVSNRCALPNGCWQAVCAGHMHAGLHIPPGGHSSMQISAPRHQHTWQTCSPRTFAKTGLP